MNIISRIVGLIRKEEKEEEKILIDLDEAIKCLKKIYQLIDGDNKSGEIKILEYASEFEANKGASINWLVEAISRIDLVKKWAIDIEGSIKKETGYRVVSLSREQRSLFDAISEAKANLEIILKSVAKMGDKIITHGFYSLGKAEFRKGIYPEVKEHISYLESLKESIKKIFASQKEIEK